MKLDKNLDIIPPPNLFDKKDYELKVNNILYNLGLQIDSKYIYFRIIELKENDIPPIFYEKKFIVIISNCL